jgi:hypothetical protein
MIADKLKNQFPGLLRLQYRLDSDKPRSGATSLQSHEEFSMFKDRMRLLIVPRRLASGKVSTRGLKPMVMVIFEDVGEQSVSQDAPPNKTGPKKVFCESIHPRHHI